ncbi:MAG: MerR family transcriptional regulator [Cyclobacteriaceae bacterium]
MGIYSIKDLEHLSGIKAHTIRIWEQRHNLFSPQRTDTNIRFYSDEDLKLILNISLLKNHGIKISKIVQMKTEQIQEQVIQLAESEFVNEDQVSALTVAMIDTNEELFHSIISSNQKKIGFEKTIIDIVYPFFKKIGILWVSSSINPAQEHFISHLIRQRLIVETAQLDLVSNSESFLLFLPEGELHEISLLFANYLLRARGYKTVYLGQSVPLKDVEEIYHTIEPDYIFTVATSKPNQNKLPDFLKDLKAKFKKSKVFITGSQVLSCELTFPENVQLIRQFHELDTELEQVQLT